MMINEMMYYRTTEHLACVGTWWQYSTLQPIFFSLTKVK